MSNKRINTDEATKLTGLSRHALELLRKQGLLPYIKVGYGRGRIFYEPDELQAALKRIEENNMLEQRKAYEKYQAEKYPETHYNGVLG